MRRAAEILEEDRRRFGEIMTLEMGKPLGAAIAEVEKCASVCRYYAEHAEGFLAPQEVATDATRSYVRYEPLGRVLAVMPWNFPFWQVFRFAAPALDGRQRRCCSSTRRTCRSARSRIEEIFRRAGFPDGTSSRRCSSALRRSAARHRRPAVARRDAHRQRDARARSVGALAGEQLKKAVLELGGSDPFIVLPSADLATRPRRRCPARMHQQRPVVHRRQALHRRATRSPTSSVRLVRADARRSRSATRWTRPPTVGPLATRTILRRARTTRSRAFGRGGRGRSCRRPARRRPGLLLSRRRCSTGHVPDAPRLRARSCSGRWRSLFRVAGRRRGDRARQRHAFGLGASRLDARPATSRSGFARARGGQVFVNGMVASDPRLPFGGIKRSGYGRELGPLGIREFVNVKTV